MKYHLRFKNFHAGAITATDELFSSKPWRGTDEERFTKFERWLHRVSEAYNVPTPNLLLDMADITISTRAPDEDGDTIVLPKFSVTTLFFAFRRHLQVCGIGPSASEHDRCMEDGLGWACSLFYQVRPTLFRKAVRAGGIRGVHPEDLLTAETLARLEAEGIDASEYNPTAEEVAAALGQAETEPNIPLGSDLVSDDEDVDVNLEVIAAEELGMEMTDDARAEEAAAAADFDGDTEPEDGLDALGVHALRSVARGSGIQNISGLRRPELLAAMRERGLRAPQEA